MKQLIFILLMAISSVAYTQPPTWQWGGRAGGSYDDGAGYRTEEYVVDMAIDNGGNLYVYGLVYGEGSPTITGKSTGVLTDYYYRKDLLLAKYNCAGELKWAKTFGGGAPGDNFVGIGVDTLGHIYVSGMGRQPLSPTPNAMYPYVRFGNDSVQPYTNGRYFFLAQYDTSGQLNWIRWLDPDSASYTNRLKYGAYSINVSKNGLVDIICSFTKSLIGDSLVGGTDVATEAGIYIVTYNVNGNLLRVKKPDFDFSSQNNLGPSKKVVYFRNIRFTETSTGNYILCGGQDQSQTIKDSMSFQGQKTGDEAFVACFNSNWQLLWRHTMHKGTFWYKPSVDEDGNIYLAGTAPSGQNFQGFITYNGYPGSYGSETCPFIFKLDSSGNLLKGKVAGVLHPVYSATHAVAGDKVYLASDYSRLKWDNSLELYLQPNYMRNIQLTTLDKNTLEPLAIDSLKSSAGSLEVAFTMEADKFGNIYIGGKISGDIIINGTIFYSAGGLYDMFWAKYGTANCTNTVVPLQLISFVGHWLNEKNSAVRCRWQTAEEENTAYFIVQRSYDGKNFMNIAQVAAKGTPSNDYTYTEEGAMSGSPNASRVFYRLLMYDKDGRYEASRTISLVRSTTAAVIHIAPNPAGSYVQLSFSGETVLSSSKILFYDVYGREVKSVLISGNNSLSIPVSDLPNGSYFIHLTQNGKTVAKEKLVVNN